VCTLLPAALALGSVFLLSATPAKLAAAGGALRLETEEEKAPGPLLEDRGLGMFRSESA
jgi:hypothetical protein